MRRKQYINLNNEIGLKISTEIVLIKLIRQKKLLLDLRNNRQYEIPSLVQIILTITSIINKIKLIQPGSLSKLKLVGLEGSCAAQYFKGLSLVMPTKWRFKQRSQHPAYDEFNAVLNYIYGIGYSDVEKIIILSGLEPNSGFYHTDSYGKATLSYDLMELVRAWLDRTVISLFTKREVKDNWFDKKQGIGNAIFLAREGRKALLSSYRENNKKKIESEVWRYCSKIIQLLMGENESEKEYVLCNI